MLLIPGRQVGQGGEVTAGDHRAAQGGAAGQAVGPRHRVGVAVVRGRQVSHGLVDVRGAHRVHLEPGRRDLGQLDGGAQDDAGQPHPAGRGPEQRRIAIRRDPLHLTVRPQQVEPGHVAGEAAGRVMVLAVHVGGDRAADGHLPGARGDRHEPAGRQSRGHQLFQADPGFAGDHAGRRVEAGDPVHRGGADDQAAVVLRRVVVAAAQAAGDHPAGGRGGQQPGDLVRVGRLGQPRGRRRDPPPPGQPGGAAGHRGHSRHPLCCGPAGVTASPAAAVPGTRPVPPHTPRRWQLREQAVLLTGFHRWWCAGGVAVPGERPARRSG